MTYGKKYIDIIFINNMVLNGEKLSVCDDIIRSYLDVDDIGLYRYYIENLNERNVCLKNIIENKRKKKYDYIFSVISSDGLLKEYKEIYEDILNDRAITTSHIELVMGLCGSKEDIFTFLYDESSNRMKDILIDRYFDDVPDNFIANLEMVINFTHNISENIIDSNRIELYKNIYNFNNLSVKEKMILYNNMNDDINYGEVFYNDYRKCKDYAYTMYNESVIKLDSMKMSNLSYIYGTGVYELNGEDFKAFIHQTKVDRNGFAVDVWRDINKEETDISLEMIDQGHFDTIYGYDSYVVLGFSNLDIDRIKHVYHTDSFTGLGRGSDRINEIFTPDDLMKNTKGYNEILYVQNNCTMENGNGRHNKLRPSYIMSYNYITDLEVSISKKYSIPIVLFHTDKYENEVDPKIDYSYNVYLNYEYKKLRK